ncbi:hypothetical protein [Arthrobacter sp. H14-L1]|uniref:hypothetical protein n=1 Tax=Arthrobacter sp. H14-L1 TaxID=2996697 RepID=UPI00226DE8BA|nr:hypothetical protein [Arthrobacter sp. H14-L1]MCY0903629.1 hypothetical protein [Arthrobacter sp. H14-L1]
MEVNPMVKPQLSSGLLVAMTTIAGVVLVYVLAVVALSWPPPTGVWISLAVVALAAGFTAWRWSRRIQNRRQWQQFANRQWEYLSRIKGEHEATAEITVLSFEEIQPTGSWATIRWNKFGYVQPGWIENGTFAIWPESVLLIRPDPTQIRVGAPWPPTYYLRSHACLAIAPVLAAT